LPQNEPNATYEPPCDDTVSVLDWKKSAEDLYNLIRGCNPQPGAHTTIKGKKVRFYDARLHIGATEKPPGEILAIEKQGLRVAAGAASIEIGKLRIDKGEKVGPMEFAQSFDLKVGDRFGD